MPDPAAAIRMLDMVEKLFDGGNHWITGRLSDRHGNHCLVGAIDYVRKKYQISGDKTEEYIRQTIAKTTEHPILNVSIEAFNDTAASYAAIEKVIKQARARAACELLEQAAEREILAALPPPVAPSPKPAPTAAIPLAVLKYLSPERRAELRESAPGLRCSLDAVEREAKRNATVESLKKSIAEAAKGREPELAA